VVYTINEPAAARAHNALKKAGKEKNGFAPDRDLFLKVVEED
jgi:hypothetical protein